MGSLTEVLLVQETQSDDEPSLVPLSELLNGESYAAVDNSGSTAGARLRVAEAFVRAIGVRQVSLWNSHCNPPVPLDQVHWRSTGGTYPHTVFSPTCHVPNGASCFVFMTDGEVRDTTLLAQHASVTAHLPSIFVIFGSSSNNNERVARYNVSVVMAHFGAARTAAVLVINSQYDVRARLIAVKGDWVLNLPQAPFLDDSLLLCDCPLITIEQLHNLSSRTYSEAAAGTLSLEDGRLLVLETLLNLSDGRELLQEVSEADLEDVARAYLVRGRLAEWRALLNRWLVQVNQEASRQVQSATRTSTSGIHALLRRIQFASSDDERSVLSEQLRSAVAQGAVDAEEATAEANRSVRSSRAVLNAALAAVAALETSGMSATSLGRLSNRAARAGTVDRNRLVSLASLDATGAPHEEDLVLHEIGPVALCLRSMTEVDHNTSDEALNMGLQVGQYRENAVFEPTIVALEIADRIEEMDSSPLTRERLSVCLPIISLENPSNRRAVFERLCIVFMNELSMQHVWLIALSSILRTLETESWADPETTPTGRLLQWFAGEILAHVSLAEGTRLSPDARRPVNEALTSIYQSEILTVHSSVVEASVILRLLHRFGAPATLSEDVLRRSMLARIATAVPQMHRNWLQTNTGDPWADQGPASLSSLTSSLYDTRVDANGAHVPIAGTAHIVEDLAALLSPSAFDAVVAFAHALDLPVDDLVTPGLTVVVAATLDHLTSPHVSSTAAVQLVRAADPAVASEMEPATAGSVASEDAMDRVRRRLAWARTPLRPLSPFTTPFGPSTLWFYSSDGRIIDMTQGFEIFPGEAEESREQQLLRLTEHIRAARGQLMSRYYGTSPTGSFIEGTITSPVHRAMADEYHETGQAEDLSEPNSAASFIHRVVQRLVGRSGLSAGNVYSGNLERHTALLLPSLLESVAQFSGVDVTAEPRPIPLFRRVTLELGERSPDNLGDAPNPVWVPMDDAHLMETLVRVQRERENARVHALRRRRNRDGTSDAVSTPPVGVQGGVPRLNMNTFQRQMTWYLRHGASSTGEDGFVPIQTLLNDLNIVTATVDTVLEVCETDEKGRFAVREDEDGTLLVRANQGHTITTVDPEQLMTPIENADDVPVCLHGTYESAFENIVRSGALNRMQRQAIQMAVGLPDDPDVRSGIRRNVDLVIYIDVERAMRLGLCFYRSENNVICCPGPIPLECFIKVVRICDGTLVDVDAMISRMGGNVE